jgi:DNA-binding NarL/FixJ family response regulator
MGQIQFIIVDDHKMLSAGLSSFLTAKFPESKIAGIFEDADSCLKSVENITPADIDCNAVAIVDLNLGGSYSFPLIKKLSELKIKVIVYTMYESSVFAMKSLECGALSYVSKGGNEADLVTAVNSILTGKTFITSGNFSSVLQQFSLFSTKEKSVAEYLLQGKDNGEIAELMGISKRSVENYLVHMYDKCGVQTRDQLKAKLETN